MDPIEKAAREAATALNREALYSTYEANFSALRKERDELRNALSVKDADASKRSEELDALKSELSQTKKLLEERDAELDGARGEVAAERSRHDEARRELACGSERADRIERESDGLRAEVARLNKSNAEYGALLSSMTTEHSKSSSEALPLRLQAKRLEQELQAVTAHSNYLDGEVSAKSEALSKMRVSHGEEVRALRAELDRARLSLERTERELSSARSAAEGKSSDLDRLQRRLYDAEVEHASQRELLERDLNRERELVMLKEQRTLLAEERSSSLLREVEELKALAAEAAEEAGARDEDVRLRLAEGIEDAVRRVREEEGRRVSDLEGRLRDVEDARLKLEESILSGETPRRGRRPLAITDGATVGGGGGESNTLMMLDDSSDPLSLTDLYARLAETEDALRAETRENQKLKILIERIHRDVAAKTPILHQKQLELEGALEELDVANERLDYARREVADVRSDNDDLELRNRAMERECAELKRENVDLATQVQSLLQRRSAEAGDAVSFEDVSSLQQQNQKLLRDHHSMSLKIDELEGRIASNPDVIELNELRSEVVSLREEREKQTKLVAGIVHQRDLYRALVAKNDAPLL